MPLRSAPSTRTSRRLQLRRFALPVLLVAALGAPAAAGAMDMGSMNHAAPSRAATRQAPATSDWNAGNAMFRVGTAHHPLIADGPRGPLWSSTRMAPVGSSSHGTFAQITVATELAKAAASRAASAANPVATREILTTAQATKTLSKTCQRLIKKKASKLGGKDRKRRRACLKQRAARVSASKTSPPTTPSSTSTGGTTPTVPGVSAPGPAVPGPTPTNVPSPTATTPTPTAAAPVATTPTGTAPTPTPLTARADGNASDHPYSLSRATVPAGEVAFGLENADRQEHNLAIAPSDGHNTITGPVQPIVTAEMGENVYAPNTMVLKRGTYMLICTLPSHEKMAVQITVV